MSSDKMREEFEAWAFENGMAMHLARAESGLGEAIREYANPQYHLHFDHRDLGNLGGLQPSCA